MKKPSYKQRVEAALKFIDREQKRIDEAFGSVCREMKEKGISRVRFEEKLGHPNQQPDFLRMLRIELPAEAHLAGTIGYVLKGILVDGDIPKSLK